MRYYKVKDTSKPWYIFVEESKAVWLSEVPYNNNDDFREERRFTPGLSAILSKLCEKKCETVAYYDLEAAYYKSQKNDSTDSTPYINIPKILNKYKNEIKKKYNISDEDVKKIVKNVPRIGYTIDAIEVDGDGNPITENSKKDRREKDSETAVIPSDKPLKPSSIPVAASKRFHYRSESLEFFGRRKEIGFLKNMCFSSSRFCWTGICGESGIGKSRLTFELYKSIEAEEDWTAFHLAHAKSTDIIKTMILNSSKNILVCFDDAMADIKYISDFFDYCCDIPEWVSGKIRVILIDRDFNDLPQFMPAYFDYLYTDESALNSGLLNKFGLIDLNTLAEEDLLKIVLNYIKTYYPNRYPKNEEDITSLCEALVSMDKELPLYVLLMVDAWCNGDDIRKWNREEGLKRVKEREYGKASDYIKQEVSKPSKHLNLLSAFKFAVAVTIFADPININDIDDFLTEHYTVSVQDDEFIFILKQMGMLQDNMIKRIYPDIINEYICIDYINSLKQDTMVDITELIFKISDESIFISITNICNDYKDILISPSNMSVFQYMKEELEVLIGKAISSRCSAYELNEFDEIDNPYDVVKWLEQHVPDYRDIVNEKRKELYRYFRLLRKNDFKVFEFESSDNRYGSYRGEMVVGWRCGRGIQTYTDGSHYEGEWNKNKWNGSGTFYSNDGTVYEGKFSDGIFNGYKTVKMPDGTAVKEEISDMLYKKIF